MYPSEGQRGANAHPSGAVGYGMRTSRHSSQSFRPLSERVSAQLGDRLSRLPDERGRDRGLITFD